DPQCSQRTPTVGVVGDRRLELAPIRPAREGVGEPAWSIPPVRPGGEAQVTPGVGGRADLESAADGQASRAAVLVHEGGLGQQLADLLGDVVPWLRPLVLVPVAEAGEAQEARAFLEADL